MKVRRYVKSGVLLSATLFASSLMTVFTGSLASAAVPPFDPSGNGATQGTLSLYDAAGNQVTSGSLSSPPVYALADADTGRAGDTKATLYAATPKEGDDPLNWSNAQLTPSTPYPDVSAPGVLQNNPNALAKTIIRWFDSSDPDSYASTNPNTNTAASWQDLYQLRLLTSGPGQTLDPSRYSSVTIQVNSAAGTWSQVYPGAPAVDSAAVISGTTRVGYTGSCDAAFTGATSTTYQWLRGKKAIGGATQQTYGFVPVDYNKKVKCRAIATNAVGSTSSTSAPTTVGLGDALAPTTNPSITGMPKPAKVLTCGPGVWSPAATSYAYQWFRGPKAIAGQTTNKYTVKSGDVGKKVSCQVTARKNGYADGVKKSAGKTITN